MSDISGLREQILANATLLLVPAAQRFGNGSLATLHSRATLFDTDQPGPEHITHPTTKAEDISIVVFGQNSGYTGAIMINLRPVIESDKVATPDAALRKLLNATSEMLAEFMPKLGDHQRNIHGGGVFDEDVISTDLIKAKNNM